MSNLKVGDVTHWKYVSNSEEYTVTAVNGNRVQLRWPGGSSSAWWNDSSLILVRAAAVHEPLVPPHALRIPSPLPVDSDERKQYPLYRGLMAYFPAALAAVAHHSYKGNEKHNPGLPMQHARGKSTDHEDCILRHLMEGDYEGVAWRALALLQEKLEAEGAPVAPGATFPDVAK